MGVGTQGWWADEREHGPLLYLVGDFKGAFDSLQMAGLPRAARREAEADGQLCRARDGCLALERGVAHPVRVGVPGPTEDRGMLLQHQRGEEGNSGGRLVAALATGAGRLGGVGRDAGLELRGLERRPPAAEAIDRTTEARAIRGARLDLPPRTVPVVLSENPCRDGVLALKHPSRRTCGNHRVYTGDLTARPIDVPDVSFREAQSPNGTGQLAADRGGFAPAHGRWWPCRPGAPGSCGHRRAIATSLVDHHPPRFATAVCMSPQNPMSGDLTACGGTAGRRAPQLSRRSTASGHAPGPGVGDVPHGGMTDT